jgi:hypothetical protein
MSRSIADLTEALARNAEAVCRHYLSNGKREGHYWMVGDVRNTPGRSLFVRLKGPIAGRGAAGKWTDAASGEHGDLLDIIRESCQLVDFIDVALEARRFLSLQLPECPRDTPSRSDPAPTGSPKAARRLIAMSQPIERTLAEAYLRNRGLKALRDTASLRFHPRCYYRPDPHSETETWPALIASVTDLDGTITGAHRTWLDPNGFSETNLGKAPIDTPRRAMGNLLGHAVRFGTARDVQAAGEGIETMLSLKMALPNLPMAAALSAAHLAAIRFPPYLRRLYIARDNDLAGDGASARLTQRAGDAGIEAMAGYGIKSFLIAQSLNQIEKAYGPNNSILDNCHVRVSFATNDERTAKRVSDALGTATEMRAMKNYAGHRLSPWLGHLMVSRQETARPLLTPGEVMQLPPSDEIVMVVGTPPVRAKKARYFEDDQFQTRILPAPTAQTPAVRASTDDWTTRPLPPRPKPGDPDVLSEQNETGEAQHEKRQQPEFDQQPPMDPSGPIENEFETEFKKSATNRAVQLTQFEKQACQLARQASMDPNDGIDM